MLIFDPENFPPKSGEHVSFGYQLCGEIPEHVDEELHRVDLGRKVGSQLVCAMGKDTTLGQVVDIANEIALRTDTLGDYNNRGPFMTGVVLEAIDELLAMQEAAVAINK